MSDLYQRFLAYLPAGGFILDAGCGSGRDSLFFLDSGYQVLAFDASAEMARKSAKLLGQAVLCCTFDDFRSDLLFDGIWACASLLHVEKPVLCGSIQHLADSLKMKGLFYMSFKYGEQDYMKDGRVFSCFSENTFKEFIVCAKSLEVVEIFKTSDVRKNRTHEFWLNCILKKLN